MEQPVGKHRINRELLDKENYFQSLFHEACSNHLLDNSMVNKIRNEIAQLLAKEAERFTGGESSSLLIEDAQHLLQSICYSISVYLKSKDNVDIQLELLKSESIQDMFYHGLEVISGDINRAESMLKHIQSESLKTENIAYQDTIWEGIPVFFHDYEPEFASCDSPGMIDYPLCNEIKGEQGIEYIKEYLETFELENDFCRYFPEEQIELLLQGFHNDYKDLLINLYELVLTNAIGCMLSQKNIMQLNITKVERKWIQTKISEMTDEKLDRMIEKAFDDICKELELQSDQIEYGRKALSKIIQRTKHNLENNSLDQLFISFREESEPENLWYEEGIQMENDKLRQLIEEIRECRYLEDKLILLKEEVHCLSDLTLILEECFYGEELKEVFRLLSAGAFLAYDPFIIAIAAVTSGVLLLFIRRFTITGLFALCILPFELILFRYDCRIIIMVSSCVLLLLYACRSNLKEYFDHKNSKNKGEG